MGKAQAEQEMDALVKELWGLVPADEAPAETDIQKLRQRIVEALARARAAKPATGMGLEGRLQMQGIQAGSIVMLETVRDWIDEIVEGKNNEHGFTPD